MPEGPEIRIAADRIAAVLEGKVIEDLSFGLPGLRAFREPLIGCRVVRIQTRGKAMFVLNDRELARERYIERGGLDPENRLLFLIGDPDLPDDEEVVFTFEPELIDSIHGYETDPADLERVQALAEEGNLVHGISDRPEMIEALRAAGAHFIGTRFPAEIFGEIPATGPVECNPVTRPDDCDPAEIEPRR